jgi:phage-related protein
MRTSGEIEMPGVEVIFHQDAPGKRPRLIEWLDTLSPKARVKCLVRLKRLEDLGHELRRPEADSLRDGIHELRASYQGIHYRMLYFFHGGKAVVVTHGVVKEREIPTQEIDKAIRAKATFELNPAAHTFKPRR